MISMENLNRMKPINIKNKEITKIELPEKEVLQSKKKKRFRNLKLISAVRDNAKHAKYRITVKSQKRGLFTLNSRVLAADKKYVVLTGGHIIPTSAIIEVK
jgi:hypothetical protein